MFRATLKKSQDTESGTVFLVQGPPGVGKIALLSECWDMAEEHGWDVFEIDPEDLWHSGRLLDTLGLLPQERKVREKQVVDLIKSSFFPQDQESDT